MVQSHGSGYHYLGDLLGDSLCGDGSVIEDSVRIFNHTRVKIGRNVYVGHDTILKGYPHNCCKFLIGDGCWIGECCYLNAAGGIDIQSTLDCPVGIGPHVTILTSEHDLKYGNPSVMLNPVLFSPVVIEKGADIGCGTVILPGVTIGEGAVIGAGSVVTKSIPSFEIWCGNPARLLRKR
jgi:acetyltransferase-like isoleucine patch superfamily enzyme